MEKADLKKLMVVAAIVGYLVAYTDIVPLYLWLLIMIFAYFITRD